MKTTMRGWLVMVLIIAVGTAAHAVSGAVLFQDNFNDGNYTTPLWTPANTAENFSAAGNYLEFVSQTGDPGTPVITHSGVGALSDHRFVYDFQTHFSTTTVGDVNKVFVQLLDLSRQNSGDAPGTFDANAQVIMRQGANIIFSFDYRDGTGWHSTGNLLGAPITYSTTGFDQLSWQVDGSGATVLSVNNTPVFGWVNPNFDKMNQIDNMTFYAFSGSEFNTGGGIDNVVLYSPDAIPEPSAVALLSLGGAVLAWRRRR